MFGARTDAKYSSCRKLALYASVFFIGSIIGNGLAYPNYPNVMCTLCVCIDINLFSKICKFADNKKIGRAVATEDEVQLLRDYLKNVAKLAIDWQMLFNVEKCAVMHIGTNNKLYTYNMNNATLKTVDVERDLGVIINKNGKYPEQCLMAAKKSELCFRYD